MKHKHKSLKDIDFLIKLTPSEQEQINGGSLTSSDTTDPTSPNGRSTTGMLPPPPPPPPDDDLYPDTRYKSYLT
ncbi:hypothetical protein [Anabaena sp. CCY 0017]|uniref:hypothetical protein n=1 Tax=Anabaena sp. CCY 0017 TaxID=3103866 RepID=UPI0039C7424A